MTDLTIIQVTYENVAWAVARSGRSYDYILDALNDAEKNGYVCTVTCVQST